MFELGMRRKKTMNAMLVTGGVIGGIGLVVWGILYLRRMPITSFLKAFITGSIVIGAFLLAIDGYLWLKGH